MTAPVLLNTAIDQVGNVLTLYFSQKLDTAAAAAPLASQFTVTSGGAAVLITSLEVVNNQVVLKLDSTLSRSATTTVSYADATSGNDARGIQNAGDDAASFGPVAVSNYLHTTASGTANFTLASNISLPQGSEIAAFDPASDKLFVTTPVGLYILNVSPTLEITDSGTFVTFADKTVTGESATFNSNNVNSVAAKNGVVAVAVAGTGTTAGAAKTDAGAVFLLDSSGAVLKSLRVGALPDMLTFSPDGRKLLVANEAEIGDGGSSPINPAGSVSIIDLTNGAANATVSGTATFTSFDSQSAALRAEGVRLTNDVAVSNDLEPEYIAFSPDGAKAFVTLQENNAIAILNVASGQFEDIVALGLKSFNGLPVDTGDRDGAGDTTLTNLQTDQPVFGQYMPDAIASFTGKDGKTYYVIANEGDDRDDFINPDETIRVGNVAFDLDNAIFPSETTLKTNAELGRLTVTNQPGIRGDIDNDGDIDQILMYGARSFSILDSSGNIVFDSGSHIEAFVSLAGNGFDDTRSDNKGPEPEGVTVGKVGDRILAFVGLERAPDSANRATITNNTNVMVYDVTDPGNVTFVQKLARTGDNATEGTLFVSAADSPNNRELLITSNEGTNTLTIFQNPVFTLQLLHFADAEAGLLASSTAPKLAALVDAFEDQFTNSITLAGGDNYIPGPFAAAGTDATVAATHTKGNNPFAADIEIHNRIGVQASTIGNHEFDNGTRAFSDAIDDAAFPYLSANLDFSGDTDIRARFQETVGTGGLEEASGLAKKIVPSAVITVNGEKIGLVGATTQIVEQISSAGGVEVKGFAGDGSERDNMALLATQLQPVINDLTSQGVNKVILMAHLQQIGNEQALAPLLTGVDIILAAGSNTRLGDANDVAVAFNGHTANFADTYPIVTAGADSKPTLIVNTDNEYTYLGRLVVDFNTAGEVVVGNLAARSTVNGAYAATDANVATAWGVGVGDLATTAFAEGTRGEQVADITEAVQAVIVAKDGDVKGFTEVYLEGERNVVRNQETNLGNLSADANAYATQLALGNDAGFVVSLKNGGGIRTAIGATDVLTGEKLAPIANDAADKPEGGVSRLDIENSLRFDNKLMVFDTTAAGLKAILEHGVASLGNQGRFPQIGGVAFSYDPSATAGSRIRDLALDGDGYTVNLYSDGVAVANVPSKITVVTLSFLASGGDGYPIPGNGTNFRYLTLNGDQVGLSASGSATATAPANALGEQKALSTYMENLHGTPATAFAEADTTAALDTRIQSTAVRGEDVLADGITVFGVLGSPAALSAGSGDDLYVVASSGDRVAETNNGGLDTVLAGFSIALTKGIYRNVENATLSGSSNSNLQGNRDANRLVGNLGDNVIDGGIGRDTLTGNAGADVFAFSSGLGPSNFDIVTDFASGEDFIGLSSKLFPFLRGDTDGLLDTADFSKFVYVASTGMLSIDTNGSRAGGLVEIALIANKPATLSIDDFIIL